MIDLDPANVPVDNTTSAFAGPSKRWRHSMSIGEAYYDPNDGNMKQTFALYGGHRLWHGYSQENTQENNWGVFETRPSGGYLDDLWTYTKILDFSEPGLAFKTNDGMQERSESETISGCYVVCTTAKYVKSYCLMLRLILSFS